MSLAFFLRLFTLIGTFIQLELLMVLEELMVYIFIREENSEII